MKTQEIQTDASADRGVSVLAALPVSRKFAAAHV